MHALQRWRWDRMAAARRQSGRTNVQLHALQRWRWDWIAAARAADERMSQSAAAGRAFSFFFSIVFFLTNFGVLPFVACRPWHGSREPLYYLEILRVVRYVSTVEPSVNLFMAGNGRTAPCARGAKKQRQRVGRRRRSFFHREPCPRSAFPAEWQPLRCVALELE